MRFEAIHDAFEFFVRDIEHDLSKQRSEASIGIERESQIAGLLCQTLHGIFVQAEVQHSVHHARHRKRRARSHRDEQRILCAAERLADFLFDFGKGRDDLFPHAFRELFVVCIKGVAGFSRDDETWRHRQPGLGHLAETCAFAAEQRFVIAAAFFEKIDPFVWLIVVRVVCSGHCACYLVQGLIGRQSYTEIREDAAVEELGQGSRQAKELNPRRERQASRIAEGESLAETHDSMRGSLKRIA